MKKRMLVYGMLLLLFPSFAYAIDSENLKDTNIEIVSLEKCVDGDTAYFLTSENEKIKARFLAVDTPESVHPTKEVEFYGKEASEYTCTTLQNAKEIRLEYDSHSDEEDRYGRKLVWVFVDDVLLQDLLVSNGYAEVAYLYDDYKYTPLLQDSEAIAKMNQVGIWSVEQQEKIEEEPKELETVEKEEKKNFLEQLMDQLTSSVVHFFDEILEKILKMIEDML